MNKEIEEIEKEVNANYSYTSPFKEKERIRTLLSHIHILEQEIQDIRNDPDHWDRKYEKFLLDKVSTLEEKVKELETIERLSKTSIMSEFDRAEQAEVRIKELEKEKEHYASHYEAALGNWNICLNRLKETEQQREHLSKELIQERMKVVELWDAMEKHEAFKRTHENVVALEDEELYKVMKEMKDGGDAQ